MKTPYILIAGTLTLNVALSVALVRSNPDFMQAIWGPAKSSIVKQTPKVANPLVLTRSAETQSYILDTIRANPDAVRDALMFLQARESQNANEDPYDDSYAEPGELGAQDIETMGSEIDKTENAFVGGNPDGDVTIVQFFDYNCPHCRRASPVVNSVTEEDGNIRLIYREFPILTPGSAFAARAALAARGQDLYEEYHTALMAAEAEIDEDLALEIAREVGLDIIKLTADMNDPKIVDHLRRSQDLAAAHEIEGTPSFWINGEIAVGAPSAAALKRELEKARAE